MVEKHLQNVVEVRIVELEDKLMDMIEMANNYPDVPVPIFEQEIEAILSKIENLTRLE
ncbi:unnamed protein product [marine sediment metagenome]|uniref:Uncharacterized protein n=1 Tax=marine sediment metagenome TaxID=412755 RepID=X1HHE3_9ZZZZ